MTPLALATHGPAFGSYPWALANPGAWRHAWHLSKLRADGGALPALGEAPLGVGEIWAGPARIRALVAPKEGIPRGAQSAPGRPGPGRAPWWLGHPSPEAVWGRATFIHVLARAGSAGLPVEFGPPAPHSYGQPIGGGAIHPYVGPLSRNHRGAPLRNDPVGGR